MSKLKDYLDKEILEYFKDNKSILNMQIEPNKPEINVDEIANKIGCSVEYKYLFSSEGSYDSNLKKITINLLDPEYRQRFTLAHELGHAILGHEGVSYMNENGVNVEKNEEYLKKEREANIFASKLLMPQKLVLEIFESIEKINTIQIVRTLAKKFNVSYIAMEYRLIDLEII